ncbi:MAG: Rpn family recombination-promoting nuclease/putative transposase [Lachnospiraceae bacterium]|nr:Rpn family recombination-promoting nuclease/putative transposase [Lachnospiraceae bacterium]
MEITVTSKAANGEYISRFYQTDQLSPCITLVIYWGKDSWSGPRSLSDMFRGNKWAAYAPNYAIYVLEVQKMTEEEILSYNDDLKMVFGSVRYSQHKKELERFLAENEDALERTSWTARNVMVEMMGSAKLKKLFLKNTSEDGKGDYTMVQALKEMLDDATTKGREEGREEGRREERKNTEREALRADKAERELAILRARMARHGLT